MCSISEILSSKLALHNLLNSASYSSGGPQVPLGIESIYHTHIIILYIMLHKPKHI